MFSSRSSKETGCVGTVTVGDRIKCVSHLDVSEVTPKTTLVRLKR